MSSSPQVVRLVGQSDGCSGTAFQCPLVHQRGCGNVAERNSAGIEQDNFTLALPAGLEARGDLAELRVDLVARDRAGVEGVMQVADERALPQAVDDYARGAEK